MVEAAFNWTIQLSYSDGMGTHRLEALLSVARDNLKYWLITYITTAYGGSLFSYLFFFLGLLITRASPDILHGRLIDENLISLGFAVKYSFLDPTCAIYNRADKTNGFYYENWSEAACPS